jgi:deoxyribonuclease (pyrimidine dimer)
MTRINLVRVEDLADQHLFAEWREIKMIPVKVRKIHNTKTLGEIIGIFENLPEEYTMSTGHVKFFYDKMFFLHRRYLDLTKELHKREFKISHTNAFEIFLSNMPELARGHYSPSKQEILINIGRISERLHKRPNWYRYYGDVHSPDFFIDRYNQQLLFDTIAVP